MHFHLPLILEDMGFQQVIFGFYPALVFLDLVETKPVKYWLS
jgi:hypothetical protein